MNVHKAKLQAIKNKKSRQDTSAAEHKKLTDTLLELKNAVDELKTSVTGQPELDTSELEGNISHLQKTIAGFEIKQENVDLKPIVEQIKQIKNVVNVPELKIEGLADKQSINVLNESITKIVDRLVSLEDSIKPGQEPYNYLPIRRVVYRGNKLEFDDSSWGGSYGGGGSGGSSSGGLTDTELRATPVPVSGTVTETNSAAIKTAVETIDNAIAGSEMQVDVVTSALPTGAATSAKQDTLITNTGASTPFVNLSADIGVDTIKSGAGVLCSIEGVNTNTVDCIIVFYDIAGSVTVGVSAISYVWFVPKGDGTNYGASSIEFPNPLNFANAIKYATVTTAFADPTNDLVVMGSYI